MPLTNPTSSPLQCVFAKEVGGPALITYAVGIYSHGPPVGEIHQVQQDALNPYRLKNVTVLRGLYIPEGATLVLDRETLISYEVR